MIKFTMSVALLLLGAYGALLIDNAISKPVENISASGPCRVKDGIGATFAGMGFNSGSVLDEGCAAREAGRMAPNESRKEFMWCSLPETQRAFGSVSACLAYNGDNDAIIKQVQVRIDHCESKSKKWFRRVTFQRNRSYDRCMNRYVGL